MKNIRIISLKVSLVLGLMLAVSTSCERSVSEDVEFATFSQNGDIFIDGFVGLGTDFFFPFIGDGAKADVFSVDEEMGFESESSIRIDVPNADDPAGSFAGANFIIDGSARNLTNFDALTFYARASQAATIGTIGFGAEFRVAALDLDLTTRWQKYIIPIPDPSKLVEVRNVFGFSAGGIGPEGQEVGYTFWIDDLRFEKLGTIAQPRPSILIGQDVVTDVFIGQEFILFPFLQTFNLPTGVDETFLVEPSYYTFATSDQNVARVNESGVVTFLREGTAEITAILNGVEAEGSLTANVVGEFETAPTPPARNPEDVISIFSEAYDNVTGLNLVVFNNPELQVSTSFFNDDIVVNYANLSFVGLGWDGTEDVSGFDSLHIDIQVNQSFSPSDILTVQIIDFGPNNSDDGPTGDDSGGGYNISGSELEEGQWIGIDIPINGFTQPTALFPGSPNLNNVARIAFVGGGITDILVDNIYFYK
ncbi:MAG: hypothetical protein AAFX87_12235 [Bacteroidota bacterium]